jgi:predicted cobalt transporter CbtA
MYFNKTKQRIRIALPAVLALALVAAPAHAASSSTSGYAGQGDVLDQTIKGNDSGTAPVSAAQAAPVTAAEPASGSSLPFTGFDVTLLLIGGMVLVGIGFAMRRLARPQLN